jgi:hypothetical protein
VEAARYGSVWIEDQGVGITFSDATLSRAADHDPDLAGLRAGISALALETSQAFEASVRSASEQRPLCTLLRASAFIEIDDAALREAVYRDAEGAALWAAPPFAEGLLVKPGASSAKLHEILTRHGARLYTD